MIEGRSPPGNAGVPPATLFLAGGGGASTQRCRQAATLPAGTPHRRSLRHSARLLRLPLKGGVIEGRSPPGNAGVPPASLFLAGGRGASARRCRPAATLPAGTPHRRSLRHSARLLRLPLKGGVIEGRSPTRERGRPARNLIPGWRRWSVNATLQAGSHPAARTSKELFAGLKYHSPLEGESAKGEARLRAGGGPTRRPISENGRLDRSREYGDGQLQ